MSELCAPSCRTVCAGCDPAPFESTSSDWPSSGLPPAVERCRRLHQLEPGYVMGCDECEASAVNYEALVSKLRRAHRMSVSDPSDRARATLYGDAADAITALVSELGARA